jgi:hypothetical protein
MIRLAERVGREPFFLAYQLALLRQEYGQAVEAFGMELGSLAELPRTSD